MDEVKKEFDFFISHVNEDKQDFVEELADELEKNGLKVGFDNFSLKLGEATKSRGGKSNFGLVIFSEHFFKKEWSQKDLSNIIEQIESGYLLPVWHRLSYEDIKNHVPSLADKFALQSEDGIGHIVQKLKEKLESSFYILSQDVKKIMLSFYGLGPLELQKQTEEALQRLEKIFNFQSALEKWRENNEDSNSSEIENWKAAQDMCAKLINEYGLEDEIYVSEDFCKEDFDIESMKQFLMKWHNGNCTNEEVDEKISVLEGFDLDYKYILFGIPNFRVFEEAHLNLNEAIRLIGTRNAS